MYSQIKKHACESEMNTKIAKKDILTTNIESPQMKDVRIYNNLNQNHPDINSNVLIQRKRIRGKVFKDTQAVKLQNGSIYESSNTVDIRKGAVIEVESLGSLWSRLGPVREGSPKKQYATGPQVHEWFPIVKDDTVTDYYIRENSFDPYFWHLDFENVDVIEGVRSTKEAREQKGGKQYSDNLFLGPAFEHAVEKYIKDKHDGYPVVSGIRYFGAELDFVVFQGKDVIIYSAKLQRKEYNSAIDSRHWNTILSACYEEDGNKKETVNMSKWEEIKGYLPRTRQELNDPIIRCISLDSFVTDTGKMTSELFMSSARTEGTPNEE